jgi:predicted nucleic acid-binding protein
MKGIADTGFLVAIANRGDRHHDWALDVLREITMPLLTCESVLSELAFHLASSAYTLSLVRRGMVRVAFDINRNLDSLADLAERYADRSPDLADLCLVRMSEEYPRYLVITTDENDFRVYRRNKRETIPLICPPRH